MKKLLLKTLVFMVLYFAMYVFGITLVHYGFDKGIQAVKVIAVVVLIGIPSFYLSSKIISIITGEGAAKYEDKNNINK